MCTASGHIIRSLPIRHAAVALESAQSDNDHSGEWKRYKDKKRQVRLAANKVTVLPLTYAQTKNADDFHEFARGLQKLLGMKLRRSDAQWERRRAQLRKALLFGDR